jgi:predicted GIY-YIG superfamily endonuclease
MEDFFTYILKCSDGSYYVGHTDDIVKRFAEHQDKKYAGYTARRLPVELVFLQSFSSRDEAFIMEKRIQGWTRKKKEALIEKNWNELQKLAKKIFT